MLFPLTAKRKRLLAAVLSSDSPCSNTAAGRKNGEEKEMLEVIKSWNVMVVEASR